MNDIDTDLPNYAVYEKKLRKLCESLNIKLKINDYDDQYSNNCIYINEDQSQKEMIATILHELGHAICFDLTELSFTREIHKAYNALYHDIPTRQQKKIVLDCEKLAWKYGKNLARKLKIPLGKWYVPTRERALNSYRRVKCVKT